MTTKKAFGVLSVACAMAATSAFADYAPTSETFETFDLSTLNSGTWWGYAALDTASNPSSPVAGFPITGDGVTHATNLKVQGYVICSNDTFAVESTDTAANYTQVEMMVKVAKPEDPLTDDVFDGEGTPHIAVAINPEGKLCVYRQAVEANPTSNGWYAVTDTLTDGNWVRVGFVMNYATSRCKIVLDGNVVDSEYGYSKESGGTTKGCWYPMNVGATKKLSSVKVCGLTQIDDVVAKQVACGSYEPSYIDPATGEEKTIAATSGKSKDTEFTYAELEKAGVAPADLDNVLNADSGMTAADKLVAGLDPYDATKFEIKDMTINGDNAVFTFPGDRPAGKYSIKYATTADGTPAAFTPTATGKSGNDNAFTIPFLDLKTALGSGNVAYFTVEAVK